MKYRGYKDMIVYKLAYDTAVEIFKETKHFPREEQYSLTDQIRRFSRSVVANIAEAWGKRMYKNHFVSKLSDSYAEAHETTSWLDFCLTHGYLSIERFEYFDKKYDRICGMLFKMVVKPDNFIVDIQ